jgi:hypothetical protein
MLDKGMKIIITEDQFNKLQDSNKEFNKTKKLVNSMFEQGYEIDEILKLTGLDKDVVIVLLYDREIIKDGTEGIGDKYEYLYNLLWGGELINKTHKYEDGTIAIVGFDRFSGSIHFNYRSEGYELRGYATLFWDSETKLPVDVSQFLDIDDTEYDVDGSEYSIVDLRTDEKFNNIKTLRQLVDYFNNDYFIMLKEELDPLLKRCIEYYL